MSTIKFAPRATESAVLVRNAHTAMIRKLTDLGLLDREITRVSVIMNRAGGIAAYVGYTRTHKVVVLHQTTIPEVFAHLTGGPAQSAVDQRVLALAGFTEGRGKEKRFVRGTIHIYRLASPGVWVHDSKL